VACCGARTPQSRRPQVNQGHIERLSSPEWAEMLQRDLLPWVASAADLGDDVLEVGPGPGLTTDLLRVRAKCLTAIEVDPDLAEQLRARLAGSNVDVVSGSAAATDFDADRFSAVACFSVLHHIPSADEQDQVFTEVLRVLQPGAAFVGTDGLDDERIRAAHVDDTFVPVDPDTLPQRLGRIGFADVVVEKDEYQFRFCARKPATAG
jgi:SAM-dependent methyltransferase